MYILKDLVLPSLFATKYGKPIQPFTQTGAVGKQQQVSDQLDRDIINNQIIGGYNFYAELLSHASLKPVSKIGTLEESFDLLKEEPGRTAAPTLGELMKKYREICGIDDPGLVTELSTCVEFFERGEYSDLMYSGSLFTSPTDLVLDPKTVHRLLQSQYYYDVKQK